MKAELNRTAKVAMVLFPLLVIAALSFFILALSQHVKSDTADCEIRGGHVFVRANFRLCLTEDGRIIE